MREFDYRGNRLFCEDIPLSDLAQEHGTPLFVYSRRAFEGRFREVAEAFSGLDPLVCCSIKANGNLSVLRLYAEMGGGADIVSGGELFRCLKAGIPPEKIVFSGVGKTPGEIAYALDSRIRLINAESVPELLAVDRAASGRGVMAPVGLRINPDVDAMTHAKTTTGKKENKFGLPIARAAEVFRIALSLKNVRLSALSVHLGSPIFKTAPYEQALRKLLPLCEGLRAAGAPLSALDIGGGFGVAYHGEKPFTLRRLAARIGPLIRKSGLSMICEPGRYLTANSGVLVTRVVYVKKTDAKVFVVMDAGMNDLIRPAFYGSYHAVAPCVKRKGKGFVADVVGPICESSDVFAKGRPLPPLKEGDCLALMSAGAYGFSMSSNYNGRPRACEIMVDRARAGVIRRRESYGDLVRGEE